MPLYGPPTELALAVNRYVPGVYQALFDRLNRAHNGIRVTFVNLYRDPSHNRRVGGARFSQHQLALGADFVYQNATDRRNAIARMKALGLTVFDEGDHVHAQILPATTAERILRALRIVA